MAWHLATQVIEVLSTYRERSQMRQQHDYELLPRIGLNLKMVVNLSRRSYFQAGYGGHYNFMEINSMSFLLTVLTSPSDVSTKEWYDPQATSMTCLFDRLVEI